jgi:hypothetical protein
MKARVVRGFLIAAAVGWPALASAQAAPDLPKGDGWASFGWQIVNQFDADTLASYDEQHVIASAGAGLYWAPRLKVEFDAATTSRSSFNSSNRFLSTVSPAFAIRRYACGRPAPPPRRPGSSSQTRGSHPTWVLVSKSAASHARRTSRLFHSSTRPAHEFLSRPNRSRLDPA